MSFEHLIRFGILYSAQKVDSFIAHNTNEKTLKIEIRNAKVSAKKAQSAKFLCLTTADCL